MSVVLCCTGCDVEKRLTDPQMLVVLQNRGMLKRETEPNAELMRELLSSIASTLPCNECGNMGAVIKDDWSDDWDDEVRCKGCRTAIDRERLEVFPDTSLCPTCQLSHEAGGAPGEEAEFCAFCGGLLKLSQRGGRAIAGYQMVCGDCGRKA